MLSVYKKVFEENLHLSFRFLVIFKELSFLHPRIYFTSFLQVMNLIGDVKGKVAVMVDDMIDTAGK